MLSPEMECDAKAVASAVKQWKLHWKLVGVGAGAGSGRMQQMAGLQRKTTQDARNQLSPHKGRKTGACRERQKET